MAKLQQHLETLNDSDRLRAGLDAVEVGLVGLERGRVEAVLTEFARAKAILEFQERAKTDMRSERSRYDGIGARLERAASRIVRLCGGGDAYRALRTRLGAENDERCWQLDAIAAQNSRRVLIVAGSTLAGFLVMLGLGWLGRDFLFPKDPVRDAESAAQAALQKGNPGGALAAIEAGLAFSPTNSSLLIWRGVTLPATRTIEATASFSQARKAMGEVPFLVERAQIWLVLGDHDSALEDLDGAAFASPKDPIPFYLRAAAHEGRNEKQDAIRDLEKAGQLAQAAGNDYLFAQTRIRLGYLMQQQIP